jgi:hypothetical protein
MAVVVMVVAVESPEVVLLLDQLLSLIGPADQMLPIGRLLSPSSVDSLLFKMDIGFSATRIELDESGCDDTEVDRTVVIVVGATVEVIGASVLVVGISVLTKDFDEQKEDEESEREEEEKRRISRHD